MNATKDRSSAYFVYLGVILTCVGLGISGVLPANAQSSCSVPPSGLVAWWPAENSVSDIIGANNGTGYNVLYASSAKVGSGFQFNGTSSYIEVPNSPALDLLGQLTIECWVKRLRVNSSISEYIIERGGDWSWGWQNYALQIHAGDNGICFSWNGGYRYGGSITDTTTFHHVAVVAVHGAANPALYIDGVQQVITGGGGSSTIYLASSSRPLHIGAQIDPQSGWNYYSQTVIDELSLYNRALSTSEIQAIYNAGAAGKCFPAGATPVCVQPASSLVGWWPADGNANDVIAGNNAVFSGSYSANGMVAQAFNIDSAAHSVRIPAQPASVPAPPCGPTPPVCAQNIDIGSAAGMTIEGWVYPNDFSSEPWVDWSGGANVWFNLQGRGCASIDLVDTGGHSHPFQSANGLIVPGVFQHVAVTYDKETGLGSLYVNGALRQSASLGGFTPLTSSDLYLGGLASGGNYFNGLIDELSLYNRALSATEIQSIYNAGVAGKCIPTPQGNCASRPSNIVSWWPAEDSASDVIAGNNGILHGVFFEQGPVNHAFSFNGNSAYVEVPDSSALRLASQFTIEFWLKRLRQDSSHYEYIVEKGGDWFWNHQNYAIQIHAVDNTVCFSWGGFNAGTGGYRGAGSILADNNWHHCAVVVVNGAANPTFYIDGVQQSTIVISGGASTINILSSSTAPLHIGAQVDPASGYNYYSQTLVDELSIYSRALSSSEIIAIYNAGAAGKCVPANPAPILAQLPSQSSIDQRPRLDTNGRIVDAHDGMMAQFGTKFYLYGTAYGQGDSTEYNCDYLTHFACYSSLDLVNWTFASGALLKQRVNGQLIDPPPDYSYYRPHVIYNEGTGKYVLWYNWWTGYAGNSYLGVAQSSSPTGPFEIYCNNVLPTGADFDLFVDDDGTAYIIYTTYVPPRGPPFFEMRLTRLTANYLGVDGNITPITFPDPTHSNPTARSVEAPVLFKKGSTYYAMFGPLCGACPAGSSSWVFEGPTALGPWTYMNQDINPGIIPAQPTYVAKIATTQGTASTGYLWSGDLWGTGPNWANWKVSTAPLPRNAGDRGQDQQYWRYLQFSPDIQTLADTYSRNLVLTNTSPNPYAGATKVVAIAQDGSGTTIQITTPPNPWNGNTAWPVAMPALNLNTYYKLEIQDSGGNVIGQPSFINGSAYALDYFFSTSTPCGSILGELSQTPDSTWTTIWPGEQPY